ncbi:MULTISPECIES: hypothetical protein [unclassified Caballeronia]|uniref:hypothetical protein n=1 Tax=unclassified Caballeronia TaxID=2646786 RepID=UPI00285F84E9|nr:MULTISPECIES: hypothetical protein [unclassified Caballeronia]MDR5773595.1 hypothetical protein [Caballeronia sp. LZ002]MDR5849029.1 hypothetical protein [Caballeronia sp. LZ003]
MKQVWVTALAKDEARIAQVAATLRRYGIAAQGHVWLDEPDKAVARVVLDAMQAADAWIVLVDEATLAKPSVRYGLSLLYASLQASRGAAPPVLFLTASGDTVPPPLFAGALTFADRNAAWPAKLVAALARAPKQAPLAALGGYRLTLWGDENIGQWFEIGSLEGPLAGFAFGVPRSDEVSIDFQAVGARGALPAKTTLEYAQEGLGMQIGGTDYVSWAVRNAIGPDDSYFVRVRGCPATLLLMPYPEGDDVEATIVRLG